MKRLFKYIAKNAKRRNDFEKGEEYTFFLNNRHILVDMPMFAHFNEINKEPFEIMRANIIISSYLNKRKLEEEIHNLSQSIKASKSNHKAFVDALREKMINESYFQDKDDKIYIPFFNRSLNKIYIDEPEKILTYPYNGLEENYQDTVIDPFDTYGSELYNSRFSHLVKVKSNEKETAFFHYDTNTIYFVNEQGRLDTSVVLFDRYLRHPNYANILERIGPVVDAYFAFNREDFIRNLHQNGFISSHLLHLIRFRDWARV